MLLTLSTLYIILAGVQRHREHVPLDVVRRDAWGHHDDDEEEEGVADELEQRPQHPRHHRVSLRIFLFTESYGYSDTHTQVGISKSVTVTDCHSIQ